MIGYLFALLWLLRHPESRSSVSQPRRNRWRTWLWPNQLESRDVPAATYFWRMPVGGDGKWSNVENWRVDADIPTAPPGLEDTVVFDQNSAGNSQVDIGSPIGSVDIRDGWAASIYVSPNNPLIVNNSFSFKGDGKITCYDRQLKSTVVFVGSGSLIWTKGTLYGIDLQIGSNTNSNVDGYISGDVGLSWSSVNNYGRLNWTSGSIIAEADDAQSIVNHVGGTIEITSSGAFASTAAFAQDVGSFINQGLLKSSAAEVRISADFRNDGGTVAIEDGIMQLEFKAEQTSGSFELHGTSVVKTTGIEQSLRIYDGSIIGNGTIDGNLTLGYDQNINPGAISNATIDPGFTFFSDLGIIRIPGTLAVTQSFDMFDPGTAITIEITNDGYDKVAVSGYAALNDGIDITKTDDCQPPMGTDWPFITAGSITIYGTFEGISYYGSSFWGMSPPLTYGIGFNSTSVDFFVARGGS